MLIITAFIAGGIAVLTALGWLSAKCYSIIVSKKSVSVSYKKNDKQSETDYDTTDSLVSCALSKSDRNKDYNDITDITTSRESAFSLFGRQAYYKRTTRHVDIVYAEKKTKSHSPGL